MIKCPRCGRGDHIQLVTPDYGFGYGTEFACHSGGNCQRYVFVVKGDEARRVSDESRARSLENANAMLAARSSDTKEGGK